MNDTYHDEVARPDPPVDVGPNALALWEHLVDFEPEEHELSLVREAVRTVDLIDTLDAIVREGGPVIESPHGRKAHPAAVEVRQQRLALARLIAALRIPEDEPAPGARRAQRRAVRGTYRASA